MSCDHQFELVQSFTDTPASECPECGKAVRKVFANVGIVFKGSGFYKTDSRGSKGSSTATTPSSSAPAAKTESAKSDATKTETPKPVKSSESTSQ